MSRARGKSGRRRKPAGSPGARAQRSKRLDVLDTIDVAKVLEEPVRARVNGEERTVHPTEAMVRQLLSKALRGDVKALLQVIAIFEKYDVYPPPKPNSTGGVMVVAAAGE